MNQSGHILSKEADLTLFGSVQNVHGNMTKSILDGNTSLHDTGMEQSPTSPRMPPVLKVPIVMAVILSLAYLVVFLLAVVNNSLVVSVICRNPQMRNVTNFFLANLAVADITVSFLVLPITLLSNLFTGKRKSFNSLTKQFFVVIKTTTPFNGSLHVSFMLKETLFMDLVSSASSKIEASLEPRTNKKKARNMDQD